MVTRMLYSGTTRCSSNSKTFFKKTMRASHFMMILAAILTSASQSFISSSTSNSRVWTSPSSTFHSPPSGITSSKYSTTANTAADVDTRFIDKNNELQRQKPKQIPITVLSGFLGSGKTTLLRHLLTSQEHKQKIAVIVNDVASVNIDAKFISQQQSSSPYSSPNIVQLQNGCACCSLSGELISSVAELVTLSDLRKQSSDQEEFDHIVVELSGVAEPGAIRANFQEAAMYGMPLMDRVRLDTMVTVIDCSTYLNHLYSKKGATVKDSPELFYPTNSSGNVENNKLVEALRGNSSISIEYDDLLLETSSGVSELLMEQTEVADVILLNKCDLLQQPQANNEDNNDTLERIRRIVQALNPRATILETVYSKVDSILQVLGAAQGMGVVDAGIVDDHKDSVLAVTERQKKEEEEQHHHPEAPSCTDPDCKDPSHDHDDHHHHHEASTCTDPDCTDPSHDHHHHDHSKGYHKDISTFVYKARRPFHPQRVMKVLQLLPVVRGVPSTTMEEEFRTSDTENNVATAFQNILRSKGFAWIANSHIAALYWSQAGSSFEMSCLGRWWATLPRSEWPEEAVEAILSDFDDRSYDDDDKSPQATAVGDRRQELVFIGDFGDGAAADRTKKIICHALDNCILSDEEWLEYQKHCGSEEDLQKAFGLLPLEIRVLSW